MAEKTEKVLVSEELKKLNENEFLSVKVFTVTEYQHISKGNVDNHLAELENLKTDLKAKQDAFPSAVEASDEEKKAFTKNWAEK